MSKQTFTREEAKEIWSAARHCIKNIYAGKENNFARFDTFEDWEQSQEPLYPQGIVSSKNKYGTINKFDSTIDQYQNWCRYMFDHTEYSIHSVINKSGETLTVGDSLGGEIKIAAFELRPDCKSGIMVRFSSGDSCYHDAVHPLKGFITEDQFEITGDSMLHVVDKRNPSPNLCCIVKDGKPDWKYGTENYVFFKEEKNVWKYISDNKPVFSRKQILDAQIDDKTDIIYAIKNSIVIDKSKFGL